MLKEEPGTVVYVDVDPGYRIAYIRGKHCWYPIALGEHPYLSTKNIEEYGFEEA